jgi:amino acid permease
METVFAEIAKHSFVVALMFAMFLIILWLVYLLINDKLVSIQKDVDNKLEAIKTSQETENKKQTNENKMVTDKLHTLTNSVTNCVAQIGLTDRKIDLILVKLGEDPIKMAQDK